MNTGKKGGLAIVLAFALSAWVGAATPQLVFYTQDFSPFSYMENGKVAGPGVEIITLVCQTMKVECAFGLYPWSRAVSETQDGKANGLFFLGKSADREAWLDFSDPLINTEYGVFVAKDNQLDFQSPKDLVNLTVGVYGPSNTSTSLQAAVKDLAVKVDMTPDDVAAFQKLEIERIDAVYSNHDVGLSLIKGLKLTNVRYAGTHKTLQYYIALTKATDKVLSKAFFDALAELEKKGEIRKILAKYGMK
jgi:polar amino acid transport system substrate-binding protein